MRYRPHQLVVPAILILLGAGLLLQNLGIVHVSVWGLFWRLWPLWLIIVGMNMMFGRRHWGWGWGWLGGSGTPAAGEVIPVQHALGEARRAEVTIRTGVSRLRLKELAGGPNLAQGELRTSGYSDLRQEYRVSGEIAHLRLEEHGQWGGWEGRRVSEVDLALHSGVPLDLRVSTGVGTGDLDLSGLQLTDLRLNTGVGEHTVVVPARGSLRAQISSGVGQLTILVPEGRAVCLHVRKGIGGVSAAGVFQRQGNTYVTPGYDQAAERMEVQVNAGIGSIHIGVR